MPRSNEYKGLKNFPTSAEAGKVAYEGVVEAEGRTAQELYSTAREWIARNSDTCYSLKRIQRGKKLYRKEPIREPSPYWQ